MKSLIIPFSLACSHFAPLRFGGVKVKLHKFSAPRGV
jgi:hypothetical protein